MLNINRNNIMGRVLILIVSMILVTGYGKIYAKKNTTTNRNNSLATIVKQLKNIDTSKIVTIADDSCASLIWTPKNKKETLYKIVSYLKPAKLYKGKIPKSRLLGVYHANIEPSKLNIMIDKSNQIIIQPVFYIDDKDNTSKIHYIDNVLSMISNNKKIYIESKDLFKWLKEDRWEIDFKMK